jgi:hypothetical protein
LVRGVEVVDEGDEGKGDDDGILEDDGTSVASGSAAESASVRAALEENPYLRAPLLEM